MSGLGGRGVRIVLLGLGILSAGFIGGACRFSPKKLSICEVQGRGEISQYIGKRITLQGIVSADRDGMIPTGLFLVDHNCPAQEDGSQGIFVELSAPGEIMHLGDELLVTGTVEEIDGETRIMCDLSEIEILSLGNDLPPPINLVDIFHLDPENFDYENWEGMLVSIPRGESLERLFDSDLLRILPAFGLAPALQMVCLQNQTITLQLSNLEGINIPRNLSPGDQVQNLVGILRQNAAGYVLELSSASDFEVEVRRASPDMDEGRTQAELGSTMTLALTPGTASVTPSATPTSTHVPSPTIIPSLTYYPVHLLISEVYPNPIGKEPDGEWVEIYNPQAYSQSLAGIKLGDETSKTGKEGMLRFPGGYHIGGNEVLVIAHQARAFLDMYGFLPDFEMEDSDARIPDLLPYDGWGGSGVKFSNNGDEVLLLDPWNGVVDLLAYGVSNATGFLDPPASPGEGHSLERYPPETDRDRGDDWRERADPSPGRLDRSPPTQAASPTQSASLAFTPSPSISPSGTASKTQVISTPTAGVITSTSSVTVSSTLSPSLTSPVQYTSTETLSPSLTPSPAPSLTSIVTVELSLTPANTISPSSTYTPSTTFTETATSTTIASPTAFETVTVTPIPSISPSPLPAATATLTILVDVEVLINEIHADPDAILGDANKDGLVHSDDDEFLEFVNISGDELDLGGWAIEDSVKLRFEFPEGFTLKQGCAVVIFGGGDPQGDFGGSLVLRAGSLGLNNAGDEIFLYDDVGGLRLSYLYGSEGGENQSLTRWPDISGLLPMILHSEAEGSDGIPYSPGTRVDGTVFGNCP